MVGRQAGLRRTGEILIRERKTTDSDKRNNGSRRAVSKPGGCLVDGEMGASKSEEPGS